MCQRMLYLYMHLATWLSQKFHAGALQLHRADYLFPYFLLQSLLPFPNLNFYISCFFLQNTIYSQQLQVYYVATILHTIVHMDYVNLVCKALLQLVWPYTEEGVVTQVWNYVLQCVLMVKTTVVICSIYCLIALEAKCGPSNGSSLIMRFMAYTLNI